MCWTTVGMGREGARTRARAIARASTSMCSNTVWCVQVDVAYGSRYEGDVHKKAMPLLPLLLLIGVHAAAHHPARSMVPRVPVPPLLLVKEAADVTETPPRHASWNYGHFKVTAFELWCMVQAGICDPIVLRHVQSVRRLLQLVAHNCKEEQ